MEFDEPDFALIDTLFSLAEAHLFMQLIELQDAHPERLPAGKSCADIYRCSSYAAYGCPAALFLRLLFYCGCDWSWSNPCKFSYTAGT